MIKLIIRMIKDKQYMANKIQTLMPRMSQAEIARMIGVDQSTVSCVLRGKSNVGQSKREKILEVCRKYNYKPNYFAKSLRSSHSNLIGIITPALIDPYFANMVHYLGSELEENEYHCTLRFSQDNKEEQRKQMLELLDNSAAGVILLGTHPELQDEIHKLLGCSIPLVAVGWTQPGTISVAADYFNGGKQACRHFVSLGRKKLGMVVGDRAEIQNKNSKAEGFRAAVAEMGLEPAVEIWDVPVSKGDTPFVAGYKYAQAFLDNRKDVDGVFCSDDTFALALWSECKQRKIRVPDDLAIIGFDDVPFSKYAGLTTIRQPISKLASVGVEMLLEQINKYPKYVAESRMLDCELVVRNSTVK
jgi:LacI family transcriptional regulator